MVFPAKAWEEQKKVSADPCLQGGARPEKDNNSRSAWENFIATFDIEDPPAQVRKRVFELARPSVPAATFDIEDHPSTGQKTGFLSLPGHVLLRFCRELR